MTQATDKAFTAARTAACIQGRHDGEDAAGWYWGPETSDETYRRVLDGLNDCDPVVLDTLPWLDLSGQWADGLTVSGVLDSFLEDPGAWDEDEQQDFVDAYQSAYDEAVQHEIERVCRFHLE